MTNTAGPSTQAGNSAYQVGERPRRRLWPWFVAGFLLVLVGMAVTIRMFSIAPTGEVVNSAMLWQYYIDEIPKLFASSRPLGPASGGSSAVLATLIQHVFWSVLGGWLMMGVGWLVQKVRDVRRRAG